MPSPIFPFPIAEARPLTLADRDLDIHDFSVFTNFLADERGDAPALIGGYAEDRGIYAGSQLFAEEGEARQEPRTIHLGIDIWVEAGTPLRTPLPGVIRGFADNNRYGDYGGTIILEHQQDGKVFYTLYGHLARRSLHDKEVGRSMAEGEVFAWLGEREENGGWPPHLHFQRINDLLGRRGDFPGVARLSDHEYWLGLCPDPSDLLV